MFTKLALRKWPKCCSRKKNTKSVIWKYFGLEADDKGNPKDADSPKYKLCFQKVTARFGNISNLYLHIRTTHPVVHKDLQAEKAEKPPTKSEHPHYTLPTRSYFSRVAIPSLYSETRAKKEKDLSTSKVEYFSATTEVCNSNLFFIYPIFISTCIKIISELSLYSSYLTTII